MKIWIASAGALLLAVACSPSEDATKALAAMNLAEGTTSPMIQYQGKSGSGDTISLKNVTLGPQGDGLKAASLTFKGLGLEGEKPVFTAVEVKDITLATALPEGTRFNLKTIAIEGLNPATGQFLASSFGATGPSEPPPPLEAWGFSKISVNGMTFAFDGAAMGQPGKVNVQLGEFSIADLKDTIFGKAHLSGFKGDFDLPPEAAMGTPIKGTFDFGTYDLKNVRGKIFADAVMAGMEAAMTPGGAVNIDAAVLSSLSSPLEAGYDEFTWSGMNIDASGAKFLVSKVEQKLTRNDQGVVTKLSMPRATIAFSADSAGGALGSQLAAGLALVGYPSNNIELYAGGDATFDPATDTTRYVAYNFGLTDALDIKVDGGVQGLTKAMGAMYSALNTFSGAGTGMATDPFADPADPATPPSVPTAMPDMSGLDAFRLVDLDMTITDKSLVTFLLGLGATFGGAGDPEAMRTEIVNMVMAMAGDVPAGVDKAVANEFATAVSQFVKQPGSLNIKVKPAQPLALQGTGAPLTKQSLGFSATFTPGPAAPAPKPN